MNIVIPLAGIDPQFHTFKSFIDIKGKPLISHVMAQHTITSSDSLIFIILQKHEDEFDVSKRLHELFGNSIITRIIPHETKGAPCSILEGAQELIDNDQPLLIELGDVLRDLSTFYTDLQMLPPEIAGIIPVQPHTVMSDRLWGYVYTNEQGNVIDLQEKQSETTSQLASTGLYFFTRGSDFVQAAKEMIAKKSFTYNDTFFVGPVYNELIKKNKKIVISVIKIKQLLGSQKDIANMTFNF